MRDEADGTAAGSHTGKRLLDPDLLDELVADHGAEMIGALCDSLAEEAREGFAALVEAAGEQDADRAQASLHALRGAALALGLVGFAAEAQRHETACARGQCPDGPAIDGLSALFGRSLIALALVAPEPAERDGDG